MDLQPSSLRISFIIQKELICALFFLFILVSSILLIELYPFSTLSITAFSHQKASLEPKTSCDYSSGRWVRDQAYAVRSYTERCRFLDPGFRCRKNGRKDEEYLKWRWQPQGCNLPRFNATDLLERSKNGRIVFAGDSLGRNQWESLICMLAQAVSNKSSIYESSGKDISKHKGFLSIRFHNHNLTVEYYRVPFLVHIGHPPWNSSDQVHMAITVDKLHWYSKQWVGADVLVFNAGHWWNPNKTINMGNFFQEAGILNMTMDVAEAFRRSLETWKAWATKTLDLETTHVYFRSYSPVHYRNGTWDQSGHCDTDFAPDSNYRILKQEPLNQIISDVIKQKEFSNKKVVFLNISYVSEQRPDGHPSLHREPGTPVPITQDCSHWCLPGVPDTWNEFLYGHLLSKDFRTK